MKAQFRHLLLTLFPMITAALLTGANAQAAAIELNGACEVGSCATVQADAISYGQSVATTPFNFNYTFGGTTDTYDVSGTYAASYGANGSVFVADVAAMYVGNSTNTKSKGDMFTIDVLQSIFDNGPGSFDGLYTETVPVTIGISVGPNTLVSADLFYNGQGVGLVGPFIGTGTYYGQAQSNLTGLTGNYLNADFQFSYVFTAGATAGAGAAVVVSSATPEPAETIPAALACGLFVWAVIVRRRRVQP